MNTKFKAWRELQPLRPGGWSYEDFKKEFQLKEYQCFYLNPEYKLAHDDDAEVLFQTDCLAEACTFVYKKFQEEGLDIAVWQPRHETYREIYQKKARDSKGRFVKR